MTCSLESYSSEAQEAIPPLRSTITMIIMDLATPFVPTFVARVLSPSIVLFTTLSLFFIHSQLPFSPSPITPVVVAASVPRRALILTLLTVVALTFLADGLSFVVFALIDHEWPRHSGIPINTVTGVLAFSGLAALGTWKDVHGIQVWLLKRVKVAITAAFAIDLTLTVLLALHLRQEERPPILSIRTLVHVLLPAFRALLLLLLLVGLASPRVTYSTVETYDDVETPEIQQPTASSFLLPPEAALHSSAAFPSVGEGSKYGTFHPTRSTLHSSSAPATRAATPALSTGPDAKVESKPEVSFEPTWSEIWARLRRISPYLWPQNSPYLQFLALLCIIVLLIGRVVVVAMPFALASAVDALEGHKAGSSPWPYLFAYTGFRFLQGSGGLSAIRDCLWAPVMQYSDREMSQLSFDHLLNLSFSWHTHRKTGEILRVLDRGAAINRTLELVLFSIIPTFVDISVALVVFCLLFHWTLGLVIFVVMFAYVAASVLLTQWRTRIRRQMNDRDIVTRGIHTDCLLNYETVKYFGGEEHEGERYREAIREYQALEYKVIMSLNLLNLVQNFIITSGLLVGSLLVAREIVNSPVPKASRFILFITYLAQLYGPLNQLGYIYRSVNQSLVDTEKLLALLNEPTEVNDKEGAQDLVVLNGEIEFDDVHFSYDGRNSALDGVSFKVPKGGSVALVGESGAGKSTILRLLYRFYDLGERQGRILIDGQDIRDVTQKSLRQAIGVVPQDPVLFNSSIAYNIGYGKFGSTPEEIEDAARSAQMHERIITFPDGYNTKVGERGVRLSGGEKQRVAIARTLLKNPPILLLDEATSALDTSTEKDIQKALQNLVRGRSSLSIAHRLSTIASADLILVLKDGQIVEQGNFKELIERDGLFATMWADQASSSDDPAISIGGNSTKKEVSGYSVEAAEQGEAPVVGPFPPAAQTESHSTRKADLSADAQATPQDAIGVSEIQQLTGPPTENVLKPQGEATQEPGNEETPKTEVDEDSQKSSEATTISIATPVPSVPIAFPTAFPTSEDQSEAPKQDVPPAPVPVFSPAVTFGVSVNSPPSRTGTPDPDSEPKRKRISSQNFQRLARRISLTTRKGSSSSIIPGLKREQSPRVSTDDTNRPESSAGGSNDSPAGSVKGEDKGKLKKKEKKSKKNTL